jgi:hypothetical protein
MANTTLIAAVTGIVVSGIVGPSATAWASRRAARKQFVRDRAAARRDELRSLLDEAAVTLGLGGPRLRQVRHSGEPGSRLTEPQPSWAEQVFTVGQRLRLRLPADDPIILAYDRARRQLVALAELSSQAADEASHEQVTTAFETARDAFLAASQAALDAPISDKERNG